MTCTQPSPFLRFALRLDAGVSLLSGLPLLLASHWLATQTQLPGPLLWVAGLICLPYSMALMWLASRPAVLHVVVLTIVVGNLLWAAGALALMLGFGVNANSAGLALLAIHVVATASFSVLQWTGLKQSSPALPRALTA
ncbi:MAG: hypothetical protein IPK97_06190 [Ahniella sp.]|nr:hypothetical protein [Ahniella sp.]